MSPIERRGWVGGWVGGGGGGFRSMVAAYFARGTPSRRSLARPSRRGVGGEGGGCTKLSPELTVSLTRSHPTRRRQMTGLNRTAAEDSHEYKYKYANFN